MTAVVTGDVARFVPDSGCGPFATCPEDFVSLSQGTLTLGDDNQLAVYAAYTDSWSGCDGQRLVCSDTVVGTLTRQ